RAPVSHRRGVAGGVSPAWSSCRLAASHLQGPKSFRNLDHLLSLVAKFCHSRRDGSGVFRRASDRPGRRSPPAVGVTGGVAASASIATDLVVDLFGYFTG